MVLKEIKFKGERAEILVEANECLTPEERVYLKRLLYEKYPDLKNHACRNSHGPTFDDCVLCTSIPHILEHVILEELSKGATRQGSAVALRNASIPPDSKSTSLFFPVKKNLFVAKTTKLGGGVAKIELKYYDDISTLQAIKSATSSLNELLKACIE